MKEYDGVEVALGYWQGRIWLKPKHLRLPMIYIDSLPSPNLGDPGDQAALSPGGRRGAHWEPTNLVFERVEQLWEQIREVGALKGWC